MPYPHEHACRIQPPKDFQKDSFKRMSSGKVDIIIAKLPGATTTTTQAFRYPIETWTEAKAKAHCERQKGAFEAAKDIEKQAEEGGDFFSVMEEKKMEEGKKNTETISMEIFRVGDYGKNGNYTEADLDEMIASYDTSIHEAPIAIGHERKDGDPAHGWVSRLYRKGQSLWAEVQQVSEDLKAWIKDGRYKKRSVEIYKDFQNTGKKYLRAVAFVQIPEVKGMQDVALADSYGFYQSFSEEDRNMTKEEFWEWLKKMSAEEKETLRTSLGAPPPPPPPADFSEELKKEKAAREKAEALLLSKEEAERKQRKATFADGLKKKGLAPALVDLGVSAFYESLDAEKVVIFAEGKEETPVQFFERFCDAIVEQGKKKAVYVEFKEVAEGVADKDREHAERQREVLRDFAEHQKLYQKLGHTVEDLEKYGQA